MGIIRISQVGGREGKGFVSPGEQRERIRAACERDGLELVRTVEELDVSGGTPLDQREGLRGAIEEVEAGSADVVMVAYFDRLVRSLRVQDEVVSRVESAGGRVVALDIGEVSGRTAAQWLSGTMIGAVSEYYRRSIGERAGAAQADAVARGVAPFPGVPPGYERGPSGVLTRSTRGEAAETVRRAFEMREEGATIKQVRLFLRDNGIVRSDASVRRILANRIYLGELRFGEMVNTEAHDPIIDRELFERVQRMSTPRGRVPHSDRLLARLGILRCGTCGSRLVIGNSQQRWPTYRCHSSNDCPRKMVISAQVAERVVVEAVRLELANVEGRASAERDAREAASAVERAQVELDAALRVFSGFDDEAVARARLAELRRVRDIAREEAHRLSHLHSGLTVNIAERWDDLTLSEQRGFIRAVVREAVVGPGRGAERITVKLLREESASDGIG